MRESERFVDPMAPRQRERTIRSSREERRVTRSRERDMDGRHGGPNSVTMSGGGLRGSGGREREREVYVRTEMPHMVDEYRVGGGGGGGGMMPGRGGMPMHGSHVPEPYLNGGGRMDMGRGVAPDYRGGDHPVGGGVSMNGHGQVHGRGGYPLPTSAGGVRRRSGDRERDRERALAIERERARDREREREKERVLLREREERARMRELKAIEDRRASEAHALRHENLRLREEAALNATRGRDGGAPAHGGTRERERDRERDRGRERDREQRDREQRDREQREREQRERDRAAPRPARGGREGREGRGRDRGAGVGRASKGTYMNKIEVDKLFLKVLQKMGEDNSRFPCTASLINDRMKNENPGYNVANSEYQRFSNVLSRFEAEKTVGTSKANDSLQVNWTKWSAPGTGTGARRPDARREPDDTRVKIRASRAGGTLQLYFCSAADEDTATKAGKQPDSAPEGGGDGGDKSGALGGGAAAVAPYADIASILQERGELLLATPPAPEKTDTPAAVAPEITESGGDRMDEEEAEAATAAAAVDEDTPAAGGGDSDDKDDEKADVVADDGIEPEANGNGVDDGKTATTTEKEEEEEEKEGAAEPDPKKAESQDVSNGNGKAVHGSPDRKKRKEEDKEMDDVDVYRRDMGWLRSANGMVAEVSTPSLGVGYKIAIMIHQRCKPCLCLFNKNLKDAEGNPAAPAHLSPMLTGDRNLDIHEYSEVSEIGAIVDRWIEKQFPNKAPNSRRGRGGRGDSRGRGSRDRDRSGRKRADKDGDGDGDGDGRDKPEGGDGKEAEGGAGGRRGTGSNNNDGQSVAEGAGADGERTESVISDDDDDNDNDEHEEVEDITGDYAAGAAATSDAGGEEGGGGDDGAVEEDEDDGGMVSNDDDDCS
eukprot:g11823.t1